MANALCFTAPNPFNSPTKSVPLLGVSGAPKVCLIDYREFSGSRTAKPRSIAVKALDSTPVTKRNSILCADCDGNGAVQCSQCKGAGVNSVDHFDGQFKAGALCWLCRGKKDILCGNCNGAGFIGGFMSTHDD
ncbi:hypothetical protein Syun_011104 [Stephania yunnanensis]|uniref:BSD2 cysteine rich domain-containing protein n=1 Tax=Stephania yunnanensis TaxID=152371 RepID=A0AAP0JXM3_9MAGN